MAILPLIKYPNPILQKKSQMVQKGFNKKALRKLVLDMEDTMKKNEGIGLAAPQIGKNIRVFIVYTKDGVIPWVNATIISRSFKKEISEEGCLSIPKVFGNVKRHYAIKVRAFDLDDKEVIFTAYGLYARVIQHEVDHLDGVLFIDKAEEITKGKEILKKYERIK